MDNSSGPEAQTIDIIGVSPITGIVDLAVVDDLTWDEYDQHIRWLTEKLNLYTWFVVGGELSKDPRYRHRAVRIVIHFQYAPPDPARQAVRHIRESLARYQIGLAVTMTGKITEEVDLDRWV